MAKQDNDYIKGLLTNDRKVIQEIYDKTYPGIVSLVKKNSGVEDDAWDMFQEGLILILKKVREPNFNLSSSFFSFFYGICYNLWRNELQKKRRTEVTLVDDNKYIVDDNIEDTMHKASQLSLYKEKFLGLGARCQELLKLHLEKRLKLKEIAKTMGYANENVVKQQKHKCQQQLILKIKADMRYKELRND